MFRLQGYSWAPSVNVGFLLADNPAMKYVLERASNSFAISTHKKRGRSACALALLLSGFCSDACAGSEQHWNRLSDVLAFGAPVVAAAYAINIGDHEGLRQLGLSLVSSYSLTAAIKSQHKAMRPDGSGDDSFPSGHTSIAFAAAGYFDKRYAGSGYGGYLYAAAAVTAVARVEARKHYWKDVIAGGALGYGMSQVFTRSRSVSVAAWPTQGGLAFVATKVW